MLLTPQQLEQYHKDGFVIVRDFFLREQLQPAIEWINFDLDWSGWAKQNRIAAAMEEHQDDAFDTSVRGPWLHRRAKENG